MKGPELSVADAELLLGASLLPANMRMEVLAATVQTREDAIRLLSAVLALSNQVAANAKAHTTEYLVSQCGHEPTQALNLPTLTGAFHGIRIANGIDRSELCKECAFRLGTSANQSSETACTAELSGNFEDEGAFLCHLDLNAEGEAHRACKGFVQARKRARLTSMEHVTP